MPAKGHRRRSGRRCPEGPRAPRSCTTHPAAFCGAAAPYRRVSALQDAAGAPDRAAEPCPTKTPWRRVEAGPAVGAALFGHRARGPAPASVPAGSMGHTAEGLPSAVFLQSRELFRTGAGPQHRAAGGAVQPECPRHVMHLPNAGKRHRTEKMRRSGAAHRIVLKLSICGTMIDS